MCRLVFLGLGLLTGAADANNMGAVVTELISQYGSTSTRPGLSKNGNGRADKVEVQFYIDRLHPIDQIKQTWGATGYLRAWWKDPRLEYDAVRAGANKIALSPTETNKIWHPSLYWERLVGASDISPIDGFKESLFIYPDGKVWRSQQRQFTLACPLDLTKMPFDQQTCKWVLGLYSSLAHEVYLQWKTNALALQAWDQPSCSFLWVPIALRQTSQVQVYDSGNYTYAFAEVDFVRGNADSWVRQYYIVSCMLVFLSYLGCWIQPAAVPGRVALGIIAILTLISMINNISGKLPPSAGSTWLTGFMQSCLGFCILCFFEQVCVYFGVQAHAYMMDFSPAYKARDAKIKAEYEKRYAIPASPKFTKLPSSGPEGEECTGMADPSSTPAQKEMDVEAPAGASAGSGRWQAAGEKIAKSSKERKSSKENSFVNVVKAAMDADGDGDVSCCEAITNVSLIKRRLKLPFLRNSAPMRYMDVYWRFGFPMVFIPYILATLSDVSFGTEWAEVVGNAPGRAACM